MGVGVKHSDKKFTCCRAAAGRGEKVCGKSKKVVDNGLAFGYNIPCQQRRTAPDKPNNGDLHSGSAVDSDSTCGSSILSSPTRPQPIRLRYFRGIAQLVARLVRDEEAVGSNPAAPTMTDILTAPEMLRNVRLFLFADLLDSDTTGAQFTTVPFLHSSAHHSCAGIGCGRVHRKICRFLNAVLGKVALLQRDPPGGKIGVPLTLPCLQAAGLLFF